MKNLFLLFFNLFLWVTETFISFFLILWYGKLPKVSIYHLHKQSYSLKDVYNNKDIQSIKNPILNERMVIDLLHEVVRDCNELPDEIPIKDKKGKIIGSTSLYGYLNEKFEEKMKQY